jgi:hypothetical protein
MVRNFLAIVVVTGLCGCSSDPSSALTDPAAPRAFASASVEVEVALNNRVGIAERALRGPLTAIELEAVQDGQAASPALVGAIRQIEGGAGASWLVVRGYVDCERGLCPTLKMWAEALLAGQTVEPTELFSRFGGAALFADVMIHDGPGNPTLRTLYAASGGSLSSFDATESAQLARLMPEVRSQGTMAAQVAWILGASMSTRTRVLCLFDLGPQATEAVATLYQADTGGGAFGVSSEDLALIYAMLTYGRGQDATLRTADAARPAVQEYVNSRRAWDLSFDWMLSRAGLFFRDERRLFLDSLSPEERIPYERPFIP